MVIRPLAVEAKSGFRIWMQYSDGAEGEVDLSHLAGRGVFKAWNDCTSFKNVHITEYDAIAWSDELELCPDALYMRLTGKSLAEIMPEARTTLENA